MQPQLHHGLLPYASRCQRKGEIKSGLITRETFQSWGMEKPPPVLDVVAWITTGYSLGNSLNKGVEGWGDPSTSFLEVTSHPRSGKEKLIS